LASVCEGGNDIDVSEIDLHGVFLGEGDGLVDFHITWLLGDGWFKMDF
jgi:hypothetical protein